MRFLYRKENKSNIGVDLAMARISPLEEKKFNPNTLDQK